MNRTTMLAIAALGLAASGILLNLRPVASQAPAPATQSERECLSQLVYVGEVTGQLHDRLTYVEIPFDERPLWHTVRRADTDWPWSRLSHGARQEVEAVRLAEAGKRCEEELSKGRAALRGLLADVTAAEKADSAAIEKRLKEDVKRAAAAVLSKGDKQKVGGK